VEVLAKLQKAQRHIVEEDFERPLEGVGKMLFPQDVDQGLPGLGLQVDRLLGLGPFLGSPDRWSAEVGRHHG